MIGTKVVNVSSIPAAGKRRSATLRLCAYLEEGPGTSRRHFPKTVDTSKQVAGPSDKFDQRTSAQCYEEFPIQVHLSCPLPRVYDGDKEPAGVTALHSIDAGPPTGKRVRPMPVERLTNQLLPYPGLELDKTVVQVRHHPEEVLQERLISKQI